MGAGIYVEGVNPISKETVEQAEMDAKEIEKLGISVPQEVQDIVDSYEIGRGIEIKQACKGDIEYGDGMTIDLTQIPPGIKKLRIYMR